MEGEGSITLIKISHKLYSGICQIRTWDPGKRSDYGRCHCPQNVLITILGGHR